MESPRVTVRLDKWLWHARFAKTRGLAARLVQSGRLRLNGHRIDKPSRAVGAGDVLTFPWGREISVVRIEAVGTRRGPAAEARTLFTDLAPSRDGRSDEQGAAPDTSRSGGAEP